eukprot:TRINITY_DN22397_c0_g1_i1.p1 TRINITY_DN22397_c0_g1~~TRINITY_DN22397_c0_g1_i1.p1  ORF type:complete len:736 (-),score=107.29 TRINITY_DN22397_c0_g1_i1:121-2328(-)
MQAIQETTIRICVVCQRRMLRAIANKCPECTQPCCEWCFVSVFLFNPSGLASLSSAAPKLRVCKKCEPSTLERVRSDNVKARIEKTVGFLEMRLEPYKHSPESKADQSFRITGQVLYGVKKIANFIPIASDAATAISSAYYIIRYGPLVLAADDVAAALQLLEGLAMKLTLPQSRCQAAHNFFGGLYYNIGELRGERGKFPELEYLDHVDRKNSVAEPSRDLLLTLRRLVRLLLIHSDATPTPADAQRMLAQALPGGELLLAELSITPTIPTYYIACTRADKTAYLILPGTSNIGDIVTDFNAEAEPVLLGAGHKGMTRSAQWLFGEVSPVLVHLYTKGYRIIVVGHSLGAGVGALFTALLRPQIATLFCYGFGTPACVDERLMIALLDCMVSVVNRDDVVPRLSVHNVQALTESILCPGQVAKTKAWMTEDWQAIQDVQRVIELKRRDTPKTSSEPGLEDEKIKRLIEAGIGKEAAERALKAEDGDITRALLRATEEEVNSPPAKPTELESVGKQPAFTPFVEQQPLEAISAGLDSLVQKTSSIFGDLRKTVISQPWMGSKAAAETPGACASTSEPAGPEMQVAAESTVPRDTHLIVPGQVIHIYQRNGLARAALTSSNDGVLSRIHPSVTMVQDHLVKNYDVVMRQVCLEKVSAPTWESFEQRRVCACCSSDFNWACVLKSEPQRMLARHNCFSCGKVVCNGCSQHRQAHPRLGFTFPVRTCDACFYNPVDEA